MVFRKITAVVLAGGNKIFSLREFYYELEDLLLYGEWYFRRGYKSLRRIRGKINGIRKPRPMVEYILHTLIKAKSIEKILVVGPEKEIKKKINPPLLKNDKIKIIQQTDSFGGNVKKGYDLAKRDYVLFVASDSPKTTSKDVFELINICRKLDKKYDIIYPVIKGSLLKKYFDLFPRPCLKVIPDSIFPLDYIRKGDIEKRGRVGFRSSSMVFANLKGIPSKRINEVYNLRKLTRKSSRDKLKEIIGKNLLKRYRKGLKMSEIEKMFFNYSGKKVKIVGLSSAATSLDVDSTKDEERINKLDI